MPGIYVAAAERDCARRSNPACARHPEHERAKSGIVDAGVVVSPGAVVVEIPAAFVPSRGGQPRGVR